MKLLFPSIALSSLIHLCLILFSALVGYELGAPSEVPRDNTSKFLLKYTPLLGRNTTSANIIKDNEPSRSVVGAKSSILAIRAEELLGDEVYGHLFSSYFSKVKKKLELASRDNKSIRKYGKVRVFFTVDKFGRLTYWESVDREEELVLIDVDSIMSRAIPFDPFPSEIPHNAISFEVTLDFV